MDWIKYFYNKADSRDVRVSEISEYKNIIRVFLHDRITTHSRYFMIDEENGICHIEACKDTPIDDLYIILCKDAKGARYYKALEELFLWK